MSVNIFIPRHKKSLLLQKVPGAVIAGAMWLLNNHYKGPIFQVAYSNPISGYPAGYTMDVYSSSSIKKADGFSAYFDIGKVLSINNGGDITITKIYDQSGYGNHIIAGPSAPSLIPSGTLSTLNSMPSLVLNGSSNYMIVPNSPSLFSIQNYSVHMGYFGTRYHSGNAEMLFSKESWGGNGTGFITLCRTTVSDPWFKTGFYDTANRLTTANIPDPRDSTFRLITGSKNNSIVTCYYNNINMTSLDTGSNGNIANSNDIYIGADYHNGTPISFSQCYFPLILLYPFNNDAKIPAINTELHSRYGI
jgi:hypothetical protein